MKNILTHSLENQQPASFYNALVPESTLIEKDDDDFSEDEDELSGSVEFGEFSHDIDVIQHSARGLHPNHYAQMRRFAHNRLVHGVYSGFGDCSESD